MSSYQNKHQLVFGILYTFILLKHSMEKTIIIKHFLLFNFDLIPETLNF